MSAKSSLALLVMVRQRMQMHGQKSKYALPHPTMVFIRSETLYTTVYVSPVFICLCTVEPYIFLVIV
jgi:hypothetical protein